MVQRESLGMYSSRGCVENCCVSTPARGGPTWSHEPWTAGQGLFCFFSSYLFYNLHVSGIGKTEMKHNKFKTNKLTTAAWTKQSRKRQDKFTRRTAHELTQLCCITHVSGSTTTQLSCLTHMSGSTTTQLCCITHPSEKYYHSVVLYNSPC